MLARLHLRRVYAREAALKASTEPLRARKDHFVTTKKKPRDRESPDQAVGDGFRNDIESVN